VRAEAGNEERDGGSVAHLLLLVQVVWLFDHRSIRHSDLKMFFSRRSTVPTPGGGAIRIGCSFTFVLLHTRDLFIVFQPS